jgi:hypothetical protein
MRMRLTMGVLSGRPVSRRREIRKGQEVSR